MFLRSPAGRCAGGLQPKRQSPGVLLRRLPVVRALPWTRGRGARRTRRDRHLSDHTTASRNHPGRGSLGVHATHVRRAVSLVRGLLQNPDRQHAPLSASSLRRCSPQLHGPRSRWPLARRCVGSDSRPRQRALREGRSLKTRSSPQSTRVDVEARAVDSLCVVAGRVLSVAVFRRRDRQSTR